MKRLSYKIWINFLVRPNIQYIVLFLTLVVGICVNIETYARVQSFNAANFFQ